VWVFARLEMALSPWPFLSGETLSRTLFGNLLLLLRLLAGTRPMTVLRSHTHTQERGEAGGVGVVGLMSHMVGHAVFWRGRW
jgi:hypothetical protein